MVVLHDNVGAWDAALRTLLGLGAVVAAAMGFGLLDPDWAPTAGVGVLIVAGYLLLTAFLRLDVFYLMLGYSTVRGRERAEAGRLPRRMRSRG